MRCRCAAADYGKEEAANFREFNDPELARLSDEELIAYIVRARAAGRPDCAARAAAILAYRQQQRVRAFVAVRLASKGSGVVEEVAEQAVFDAIRGAASFEGGTLKEFRRWVFVIARRRIADRIDKQQRKQDSLYEEVPLEQDWGEGPQERPLPGGDPIEAFERGSVFNQAFGELRKDSHKLVVLLGLYGYSHREIARKVTSQLAGSEADPISENNVSKILSRFNKRLDDLLEEADDPPPPPDDDD